MLKVELCLIQFFKAENALQIAQNCKIFWLTETWSCSEGRKNIAPKFLTLLDIIGDVITIRVMELPLFQLVPIQLQGCAPE